MEENEIPSTSRSEVEGLIRQIRQSNIDPAAKDKIERLLRTILMLVNLLEKKNSSITKLKKLIFGKSPNATKTASLDPVRSQMMQRTIRRQSRSQWTRPRKMSGQRRRELADTVIEPSASITELPWSNVPTMNWRPGTIVREWGVRDISMI
jgi:hypothetical protein